MGFQCEGERLVKTFINGGTTMKKTVVVVLSLFTIGFIFTPVVGYAEPKNGEALGVPHLLGDILVGVEMINDRLAELEFECCSTIKETDQSEALIIDPESSTTPYELVTLTGPGTFVAARMTKQGGNTGLTAVELIVDGNVVVGRNFAALKNWGMTQNNPFGVVVLTGGIVDTAIIGFQQPLHFENSLILRARVNETGVVQIIGTVIHGK